MNLKYNKTFHHDNNNSVPILSLSALNCYLNKEQPALVDS